MSAQAMSVQHVDRYSSHSSVSRAGIFLAASSSAADKPPFFRGRLEAPRRSADLMLTLAHIVETRFYSPPAMVRRLIIQRDPVITCGGGMLRLEGFSACCGVYARLDLSAEAFDADCLEPGTSNVDFNPPMRNALAKLDEGETSRMEVSASGFTLETESSGPAFERRVELPVRWIKGLVEVQAHQLRMEPQFEVSGAMARRFLRDLPRQRMAGPVWLRPHGDSLRLNHSPVAGGVRAGGIERLRILTHAARHATAIQLYASGDGATAWRLETPDSRFFLVLSPEPSRGFSGEGQALRLLSRGSTVTSRVRALLKWQSNLAPLAMAGELQVPETDVAAALAELGTSGLVGYDLAEGVYFHRELPFDLGKIERFHPRLANARDLARAGAVEIDTEGAWVRGRETDYRVRLDQMGQWHCSCPWAGRNGESRGPCKHILAAQIVAGMESGHDDGG